MKNVKFQLEIRREANEELKKLFKNKEIGEDEEKSLKKMFKILQTNILKL